jgi:hypothetical protein
MKERDQRMARKERGLEKSLRYQIVSRKGKKKEIELDGIGNTKFYCMK